MVTFKDRRTDVKRGFSAMTSERRREVARQGGLKVQSSGLAHRWSSQEASVAGSKGGAKTVAKYGSRYMSELGRKGGSSKK